MKHLINTSFCLLSMTSSLLYAASAPKVMPLEEPSSKLFTQGDFASS